MIFKDKFLICNTEFEFNLMDISKAFRINVNKIDLLVDFDSRLVVKLFKSKGILKLCSPSSKMSGVDIIPYLKSDYSFMNQIIKCIEIMQRNYQPVSLDYSEITGDSVICNKYPLYQGDIVVKWTNSDKWDSNKTLITIF